MALNRRHFGKSIGPAGSRAKGGRGINHPNLIVLDHADRLTRGLVRQTQDHGVNTVDHLGPRRRVLTAIFRQGGHHQVRARGEALADLKTRRSHFTVDENPIGHDLCLLVGVSAPVMGTKPIA